MTGCAGSSSTSSTVAQHQRAARPLSQRPATQARALPPVAPSGKRRRGPSEGKGVPEPGGSSKGGAPGAPGKDAKNRVFQAHANALCQAMRSGSAPVPPKGNPGIPPAAREERQASEEAASATAARTIGTPLRPPPSLRSPVSRLLNDLHQMQQMYMASGSQHGSAQGAGAALQGSIFAAEQRAEMDAAAAGVPACFPRTPGG